jgi:hypothetical protein
MTRKTLYQHLFYFTEISNVQNNIIAMFFFVFFQKDVTWHKLTIIVILIIKFWFQRNVCTHCHSHPIILSNVYKQINIMVQKFTKWIYISFHCTFEKGLWFMQCFSFASLIILINNIMNYVYWKLKWFQFS